MSSTGFVTNGQGGTVGSPNSDRINQYTSKTGYARMQFGPSAASRRLQLPRASNHRAAQSVKLEAPTLYIICSATSCCLRQCRIPSGITPVLSNTSPIISCLLCFSWQQKRNQTIQLAHHRRILAPSQKRFEPLYPIRYHRVSRRRTAESVSDSAVSGSPLTPASTPAGLRHTRGL
ncbi:hypothetical protein Enr10x_01360 [Gimesia panareensis]|uniref:Uncharacterized protein n=1 Tax=Gimesia panareensis TaxID=2527978 RepID=A0A517PZN4_9PLAN|nr:hypothetical protein Enr10x_01360 [Gimesia panareensis]QDU47789.1 hypothetical protein Pan110_00990 [Gimesia panareensis]